MVNLDLLFIFMCRKKEFSYKPTPKYVPYSRLKSFKLISDLYEIPYNEQKIIEKVGVLPNMKKQELLQLKIQRNYIISWRK